MHAWGLRLRRVLRTLAMAHPSVLPSAMRNDVGTLVADYFAAQYPACMCPCQRFNDSLAAGKA